ncbi:hypothetical protein G6F35_014030 [Rhizopus arrhizus]|nr:hypothetical protein G6F35_014030 [Rhizopus arrhizus]
MYKFTQRLPQIATLAHSITRQAIKRNYAALTFSTPTAHEAPTSLQSFTEEELMLKDTDLLVKLFSLKYKKWMKQN